MSRNKIRNEYKFRTEKGTQYVEVMTRGKHPVAFKVDKNMWDKVKFFPWYSAPANKSGEDFYIFTMVNGVYMTLHKFLTLIWYKDWERVGREVHHKSHHPQDNRRNNIEMRTRTANAIDKKARTITALPETTHTEKGKGMYCSTTINGVNYKKYFGTKEYTNIYDRKVAIVNWLNDDIKPIADAEAAKLEERFPYEMLESALRCLKERGWTTEADKLVKKCGFDINKKR